MKWRFKKWLDEEGEAGASKTINVSDLIGAIKAGGLDEVTTNDYLMQIGTAYNTAITDNEQNKTKMSDLEKLTKDLREQNQKFFLVATSSNNFMQQSNTQFKNDNNSVQRDPNNFLSHLFENGKYTGGKQ